MTSTLLSIIGGLLTLAIMYFNFKAKNDAQEKERKDALHKEAKEAISSGDLSRINAIFDKLRSK